MPTARVRRIEPLGRPADLDTPLQEIADDAFKRRTGREPIDIDSVESARTLDDDQWTIDDLDSAEEIGQPVGRA